MRFFASTIVCICVLYVFDSLYFDGWYFAVADQIIDRAMSLN